jgi:hypothetical protein
MPAFPVDAKSFLVFPRYDDTQARLQWKTTALLYVGMGLAGVDWVSDGVAHTGDWWVFHAVTDCVISDITYEAGYSSGSPAGVTIKAGDRVYGRIKSLTLTSGTGELYRAVQ